MIANMSITYGVLEKHNFLQCIRINVIFHSYPHAYSSKIVDHVLARSYSLSDTLYALGC